jgi:uncharacterized SAM-binding protein YcdF (DUF218 family)
LALSLLYKIGRAATTIARGLGAFFALYAGISLLGLVLGEPHNQNAWWIDLSMLPSPAGPLLQLLLVIVLVAFTLKVPQKLLTRLPAVALCALFCACALLNIISVYDAQAAGSIRLGFPLPFSFFVAVIFCWLALALFFGHRFMYRDEDGTKSRKKPSRWPKKLKTALGIALTVVVLGVLFPFGQILCFGTTDYRQPVDAAVVFGARVYPDGTPSLALRDRLDAAIAVYEQGYAPVLIMSGGIDADGVNEARAMKNYAVSQGVPEEAVLVDEYGNSTRETAENTIKLAQHLGYEHLGVVSTFYHMARIKMLYLVNGWDVYTMPAPIDENDSSLSYTTLREIPGWWYYWLTSTLT